MFVFRFTYDYDLKKHAKDFFYYFFTANKRYIQTYSMLLMVELIGNRIILEIGNELNSILYQINAPEIISAIVSNMKVHIKYMEKYLYLNHII